MFQLQPAFQDVDWNDHYIVKKKKSGKKTFCCKHCEQTFKKKKDVVKHVKEAHELNTDDLDDDEEGEGDTEDDSMGEGDEDIDEESAFVTKRDKALYSSSKRAPSRPGTKTKPLQIDTKMADVERAFRKANFAKETAFEELTAETDDWKVRCQYKCSDRSDCCNQLT